MNKGGSSYQMLYRSEEFGEEDVWDVMNKGREIGFKNGELNGIMIFLFLVLRYFLSR